MAPLPAVAHVAGEASGFLPEEFGICSCCGEVMAHVAEGLDRWRECSWCSDGCVPEDHPPRE